MQGAEIKISLLGLKELEKGLLELPEKLRKEAVYSALRQASDIVKKDAQDRIPVRVKEFEGTEKSKYYHPPGTLKFKGLSSYPSKLFNKYVIEYVIATNKKYGWYGLWVERGHLRVAKKTHKGERFLYKSAVTGKKTGRPGRVIGWVNAKPFLRPALQSKAAEAIDKMASVIKEWIGRYKLNAIRS